MTSLTHESAPTSPTLPIADICSAWQVPGRADDLVIISHLYLD